jgi:hypothetical protein
MQKRVWTEGVEVACRTRRSCCMIVTLTVITRRRDSEWAHGSDSMLRSSWFVPAGEDEVVTGTSGLERQQQVD